MAITQNDFKKIWASTSSVPEYTFSDADYQGGWEFVNNLPPTRAMWDTLQRRNDQKMKYLQDNGSMCFESVADMVSTDLEAGQTVFTKGYYSVNDGGNAFYTIREKEVSDVDDGKFIIFLNNGNVAERIKKDEVYFLFPKADDPDHQGDCQIIKTANKVMMIDAGAVYSSQYILDYCVRHGIKKVDIFLLTHYHSDHYGNIQHFVNQSAVDFSDTMWYLPTTVTADDTTAYNLIMGWLGDASTTIVADDMTIDIEPQVSVDLFNCSPADRQYYQDLGITDANQYSIFALVKHGDVRALYSADALSNTWKRVFEQEKYEKVNLYKVNHHGYETSTTYYAYWYLRKINPDISVCNKPLNQIPVSDLRNLLSVSFPLNYLTALGSEISLLMYGDNEFLSDGKSLSNISEVNTIFPHSATEPTAIRYFVDASTTLDRRDGSEEYPFKSINEALAYVPDNSVVTPYLYIKTGTYTEDVKISNIYNRLIIYFDDVTIAGNLTIDNANVTLGNGGSSPNLTVNNLAISDSNVAVIVSINANVISLERSQAYFSSNQITLTTPATTNQGFQVRRSIVQVETLTMTKSGSIAGIGVIGQDSHIVISTLTMDNYDQGIYMMGSMLSVQGTLNVSNINTLIRDITSVVSVLKFGTYSNIGQRTSPNDRTTFVDLPA